MSKQNSCRLAHDTMPKRKSLHNKFLTIKDCQLILKNLWDISFTLFIFIMNCFTLFTMMHSPLIQVFLSYSNNCDGEFCTQIQRMYESNLLSRQYHSSLHYNSWERHEPPFSYISNSTTTVVLQGFLWY